MRVRWRLCFLGGLVFSIGLGTLDPTSALCPPIVTRLAQIKSLHSKSPTGNAPQSFVLDSDSYARAYPAVHRHSSRLPQRIIFESRDGHSLKSLEIPLRLKVTHITDVFSWPSNSQIYIVGRRDRGQHGEVVLMTVSPELDSPPNIIASGEEMSVSQLPEMGKALITDLQGYSLLSPARNERPAKIERLDLPLEAFRVSKIEKSIHLIFALLKGSTLTVYFVNRDGAVVSSVAPMPFHSHDILEFHRLSSRQMLVERQIRTSPLKKTVKSPSQNIWPAIISAPYRSELAILDSADNSVRFISGVSSPSVIREITRVVPAKSGAFIQFKDQKGNLVWSHLDIQTLTLKKMIAEAPNSTDSIDADSFLVYQADTKNPPTIDSDFPQYLLTEDAKGNPIVKEIWIPEDRSALYHGYSVSPEGIHRINKTGESSSALILSGAFEKQVEILETDSPENFLILASTKGPLGRRHLFLHRTDSALERLVTELPGALDGEISEHRIHSSPEGTFVYLKTLVREEVDRSESRYHHIYFISHLDASGAERILSTRESSKSFEPSSVQLGFVPRRPYFWTTHGSSNNIPQLYLFDSGTLIKVPGLEKIESNAQIFEIVAETNPDLTSTLTVFHSHGVEVLSLPHH